MPDRNGTVRSGSVRDEQKNERTGSEPRTRPEPRRTELDPEPSVSVPVPVLEFENFRFLGRFSVPTFLKNSVLGSISSGSSSTGSRPILQHNHQVFGRTEPDRTETEIESNKNPGPRIGLKYVQSGPIDPTKEYLAEYMILSDADSRPPMLDKDLEWSVRTKKYDELSAAEKIQADCDMKATNIIFQGLPADIYSFVNHHREMIQLLVSIKQWLFNNCSFFETEDLDTYDSDCDDLLTTQAVLMANISNYGYEVISEELQVIDKQLVEQLRFDDSCETEMYVMLEWMNDRIKFVMDNEMSNIDSVELILVVMVKNIVEVEDCCKRMDKCYSEVVSSVNLQRMQVDLDRIHA
nr:hypothetical protein [Tanacetum cinerariifolium]